jgi:Ca-activated chloride channel homolog
MVNAPLPPLAARRAQVGQTANVRPLKDLLNQVEKGTQVRRTGLDRVSAELTQHRDATSDPDLRLALDQLCEDLSGFLQNPAPAQGRRVLVAVEVAKRFLTPVGRGRLASRLRFWE